MSEKEEAAPVEDTIESLAGRIRILEARSCHTASTVLEVERIDREMAAAAKEKGKA